MRNAGDPLCTSAEPSRKKRKVVDSWDELQRLSVSEPSWSEIVEIMLERHGHEMSMEHLQVPSPCCPATGDTYK